LLAAEKNLTAQVTGWLRMVKRALGLRKPDLPLGYPCPWAESAPENHLDGGELLAAGDEGFLRPDNGGFRVGRGSSAQVYWPARSGGAAWAPRKWPWLARMLAAAGTIGA